MNKNLSKKDNRRLLLFLVLFIAAFTIHPAWADAASSAFDTLWFDIKNILADIYLYFICYYFVYYLSNMSKAFIISDMRGCIFHTKI